METMQKPSLNTSFYITWNILKHISNHEDKKRMRQVCRNWRTIIDESIGLDEVYLDGKNKAKIFSSLILSNCSSLKIYKSGGMARWYICPFSSTKLYKIVVVGEILVDNWALMMKKCKMLDVLIIQMQKDLTKKTKQLTIAKWNSWFQPQQLELSVPWLTRLFFRCVFVVVPDHHNAIINMLKSIQIPHLKQFVLTYNGHAPSKPQIQFSNFKKLIREMKQKCHGFKTFCFLPETADFANIDLWNKFYKSREDVLLIHDSHSSWWEIAELFYEDKNLVELLYEIDSYFNDFERFPNCIENAGRNSKNIRSLILDVNWRDPTPGLNCASLVSLQNLKFLTMKRSLFDISVWRDTSTCILNNLMLPPSLVRIKFNSVLVSTLNITTILQCPKITEVCFQNQGWNTDGWNVPAAFTRDHLVSALNHPTLKIIVFDEHMKPTIMQMSTLDETLKNKWSYLDQNSASEVIHQMDFRDAGDRVERRIAAENIREIQLVPKAFVLIISANTTEAEIRDLEKRFK